MKNYVGLEKWQDIFHPPFWWCFNASAKKHDENYTIGGTREDRLRADVGFFWRCLHDANKIHSSWQKRQAVCLAICYYVLVRLFGWCAFTKPKKPYM